MLPYLQISDEVKQALSQNKPVVALESTIISHGMPYPDNVTTALKVEQIIRNNGATPATIAIIQGQIKVGLNKDEIDYIGKTGKKVTKISRRDISAAVALKLDGATTVSATMILAHIAGIKVFATGGIGGVHRNATATMDISADLDELARTPVLVVCAGAKAILDLPLTREYLETKGVTVCGYNTDEMPAFYSRQSGLNVDYNVTTPTQMAVMLRVNEQLQINNGTLLTVPIPHEYEMPSGVINKAIEDALEQAEQNNIKGKAVTPFLLAKVAELTKGQSLASNIQLVYNNALVATLVAVEYCKLN